MKQVFADWWQALLNLIFPACRCVCCGQEALLSATGLCPNCKKNWEDGAKEYRTCNLCPTFIPVGEDYCINCWEGKKHWFDSAIAVFPYHGVIRDTIHDFKYRGRVKWAKPLGRLMVEAIQKDSRFHHIDMLIPVPLHERRKSQRGYNQSELLAKEIGLGLGLPMSTGILIRVKNTPSQTGLKRKGRQENLTNAFQVLDSCGVQGKNILLIDDIYTTGATVEACSRILKREGARRVLVITFSAGKYY
ncbi:MAG: ComF family protein [Bacillota bacterium]|nr:ComF family protein [Clostridia bacterium]